MVASFFTAFDPELKITSREGKVFNSQDSLIQAIRNFPEVEVFSRTLEENAMVQYKDRQAMAVIKGVENNFRQLTSIDSILYGNGHFMLNDSVVDYAIMGIELVSILGTGIQFVDPLSVYTPKRSTKVNMSAPTSSFNKDYLFSPGCVFIVNQQKYDKQYILTSLSFAQRAFDYQAEVSAIELKLAHNTNTQSVKSKISRMLGDSFIISDRYEQQADVYRMMEIEKLISYFFLTFILLIACFNVIGSLSMLILDKREDIQTLHNLGADKALISRIFFIEGCMISLLGALGGIALGVFFCLIQQEFGLISLNASGGSFLIDAYPVSVHTSDVVLILLTVFIISVLSVWWPVKYLTKRIGKV